MKLEKAIKTGLRIRKPVRRKNISDPFWIEVNEHTTFSPEDVLRNDWKTESKEQRSLNESRSK